MKREEAEVVVRSQKLVCLGPWNEGKESEYVDLIAAGKLKEAGELRDTYRGIPRKIPQHILKTVNPETGKEEAETIPASVVYDSCGFDLSALVAMGPLDGSAQTVLCPKCNRSFEYRAPVFEIEEEKNATE